MRLAAVSLCLALAACVTPRAPPVSATAWEQHVKALQQASSWQLTGRAAVALGTQGWQASLDWRQSGVNSDVHLSGPFGVGAMVLERTPAGLSLNGAPPSGDVLAQLQDKLGFELPLDGLRYWLLGIPQPDVPFDLQRNDQDRAQTLVQAGWTVGYDRYLVAAGDTLPAHVVLSRDDVRVRIVIDHWSAPP